MDAIPGPSGQVPVIGVAAASVLPAPGVRGGSYCLFEIETAGGFSCRMTERGVVSESKVETLRQETLF